MADRKQNKIQLVALRSSDECTAWSSFPFNTIYTMEDTIFTHVT